MITNLMTILLQAEAPAGPNMGIEGISTFVMIGLMFVVFYFLLIRPQQKKQKAHEKLLGSLKKGEKVTSIGGIRGTLVSVKEKTVVMKVDDNCKMEFLRSAISEVITKSDDSGSDDSKDSKDSKETKESKETK